MSDEEEYDDNEFQYCGLGNKKRFTKNEQIYGDFYEAYEPEDNDKFKFDLGKVLHSHYDSFKAGDTIENYSAEVSVDIPLNAKKKNSQPSKPKIGEFTLQSFLSTVNEGLDRIDEEDNESRSQEQKVEGLNQKVKAHLKLIKIGYQSQEEEQINLNDYLELQRGGLGKHNKKAKKTEHQKQLEREYTEGYGKGLKIIEKMGYVLGKGLGKDEQGMVAPVQAELKTALTTKDKPEQKKKKKEKESQSDNDEVVEVEQKKYQNEFEEMFLYRSKNPKINQFLIRMKNKYEIMKEKINRFESENESFQRELEISENLRIQKQNQIKNLNQKIQGLKDIQENIYGFEKHPHLGLSYKADLLILRESLQKLKPMSLNDLKENLELELSKTKKVLYNFYLEKEKETLKEFDFLPQPRNPVKKQKQVCIVNISPQDEEKLNNYISTLIEETVLPKIQAGLKKIKDISQCNWVLVDVLEIIKKYDRKCLLLNNIKEKYLKPLCNKYLQICELENPNVLPHIIIFPWMLILSISELNIQKFIKRICGYIWRVDEKKLYNLVVPWFEHINKKYVSFFLNFYLAPRLLHEMENLDLSKASQKSQIRGLLLYGPLLPAQLLEEILRNSIILKLVQTYKSEKGKASEKDLNEWMRNWESKLDKLSERILKRILPEHDINIWI